MPSSVSGPPGKEHAIRLHPPRRKANTLGLSGCFAAWRYRTFDLPHLGGAGVCQKPGNAMQNSPFCDVSSSQELRTKPPAPDEIHQDIKESQDSDPNHNPSFSLPPTEPIAVHTQPPAHKLDHSSWTLSGSDTSDTHPSVRPRTPSSTTHYTQLRRAHYKNCDDSGLAPCWSWQEHPSKD